MDIRPIRTEADHTEALREIERLWSAPDGSPEADKLEVLTTLVAAYEDKAFAFPEGSPLDILAYAISDMGRSQKELAELLGSRSQASEFLSGRRRLSVEAARKISAAWSIPVQLLVAPYPEERAA